MTLRQAPVLRAPVWEPPCPIQEDCPRTDRRDQWPAPDAAVPWAWYLYVLTRWHSPPWSTSRAYSYTLPSDAAASSRRPALHAPNAHARPVGTRTPSQVGGGDLWPYA
jgi:hypothetical protein